MRPSDSYWNSVGDGEKVRLLTDCYVVGNRVIESDEQLRYMREILYDYNTVHYYRDDVRRIHLMMEHTKLTSV